MGAQAHTSTSDQRGQRGVTVAELVLVTVVVVGLVVIATTNIGSIRNETAASNCQSELRTLKLATEQYHAENDAYPIDKTVLVDGGLVDPAEVEHWTVAFESADVAPTYRPTGPCA